MPDETEVTNEIFPKETGKSYALVELMRGDSPVVGKGPDNTVFSFPVILLWEIILLLGITLLVFFFSLVKQAPLDEIANPLITTDPAKAPWYFIGLQELLEHMHPTLAGVIIPGILVGFLMAIPYIDTSRKFAGVWFSSYRGKRIAALTGAYTLVAISAYIFLDNRLNLREMLRGLVPQWVVEGLIPAAILFLIVALPIFLLWRRGGSRREIILALFTIMLVSAIVLTISGFMFRGPGFKLYWPWEMPNGYNPWDDL